jgi:hypothetical protein
MSVPVSRNGSGDAARYWNGVARAGAGTVWEAPDSRAYFMFLFSSPKRIPKTNSYRPLLNVYCLIDLKCITSVNFLFR